MVTYSLSSPMHTLLGRTLQFDQIFADSSGTVNECPPQLASYKASTYLANVGMTMPLLVGISCFYGISSHTSTSKPRRVLYCPSIINPHVDHGSVQFSTKMQDNLKEKQYSVLHFFFYDFQVVIRMRSKMHSQYTNSREEKEKINNYIFLNTKVFGQSVIFSKYLYLQQFMN